MRKKITGKQIYPTGRFFYLLRCTQILTGRPKTLPGYTQNLTGRKKIKQEQELKLQEAQKQEQGSVSSKLTVNKNPKAYNPTIFQLKNSPVLLYFILLTITFTGESFTVTPERRTLQREKATPE